MIQIGVAYATPLDQIWHDLSVPEGTTIKEAIEASGILNEFPEIDLTTQKVGIFGHIATLDTPVEEGDRVEIYRPIITNPQTVQKRKYKLRRIDPIIERADNKG